MSGPLVSKPLSPIVVHASPHPNHAATDLPLFFSLIVLRVVQDEPEVDIEDESSGILRKLRIRKDTTADEAIAQLLQQYRPSVPDSIQDPVSDTP